MEKTGKVLKCVDDKAVVRIFRESACSGECQSCAGCGRGAEEETEAFNPIGAAVGDNVVISMPDHTVILSAFLIYFLPIVLGIFGYITVRIWGALAGFCLPYLLVFIFRKSLQKRVRSTVIKILN